MSDQSLARMVPQNDEAEQAVLASMFHSADAINEVVQLLREDDFYHREHAILFQTMIKLNDAGQPIDLITMTERLRKDDLLDKAGGLTRVAAIAGATATAFHISHYATIVREKSVLRQLIQTASHITNRCFDDGEPVETILDDAERHILDISQSRQRGGLTRIYDVVESTLDRLEVLSMNQSSVTGVPSGFIDLDRITAGWQKSDLIILAARPAMGKTAFCLNIAAHAAVEKQIPVAVFSLEMSKEQLVQRMISSASRIDQQYLRTGNIPGDQWPELINAIEPLATSPLYIDDTPAISIREVRAKSRRLQAERKDLGLILIDYMQLMSGSGHSESRQQEVSQISRSLKGLARELNVPIIALSQLSRAVESTTDKRPQLSHLRESGSIEQDADMVMFIYREDYYFPETERGGIADIIIAKHRNGPTGNVELTFTREFTRFDNLYRTES